jgi:hypothetical protein
MSRLLDDLDAVLADTGHLDDEPTTPDPASASRRPANVVMNPGGDSRILAAAIAAATGQARLDERLVRAPAALRTGWIERWAVLVAAESARLDFGDAVEPREVILDELTTLSDAAQVEEARRILPIVRLALRRRSEADILTPRRLTAAVNLRPRRGDRRRRLDQHIDEQPALLRPLLAGTDPDRALQTLEDALDPLFLAKLRQQPPLIASARLLSRWHAARAADVLGNAIGRTLADLRLRLARGTRTPLAGLAVGFRGRRADYVPADDEAWLLCFLRASTEAAKVGLRLLDDLERAAAGLDRHIDRPVEGEGRRKRRRRADAVAPRLATLLVERPALTIKGATETLTITDADGAVTEEVSGETVRRVMVGLLDSGSVVEIAGRDSFRVIALPIPSLDLKMAPRPLKRRAPVREAVVASGYRPINDW